MKRLFFIVCLSFAAASSVAQSDRVYVYSGGRQVIVTLGVAVPHRQIGKAVMEFMYDYSYLTDTADATSVKTDRMILQVAGGMSKFTSYTAMRIDSLISVSTAAQVNAAPAKYVGGESFTVYKNYPQGKYTNTEKVSADWFMYEEDIPVWQWTLTGETKTILGYVCKGASCMFRGRAYKAYYSDEIPIADGPWKLGGLPGLIMEACDVGGEYMFTCVGINSHASGDITIPELQYNRTTRESLYKAKFRYDSDPIGYLQAVDGVRMTVSGADGKPMSDIMEPRTLKYDYIERDWDRR